MASDGLFEQGLKGRNDLADKLTQPMKRWEQITLSNRKLDERFIAGVIHGLFLVGASQSRKEWIIGFERDSIHDEILADRKDASVFVGNVQLVEQPERLVPALVWFEPVDCLNCFGPRTTYAFRLFGFISLRVMRDRELNRFPPPLADDAIFRANADKMKCQVVQSTHEVVSGVSSNCGNIGGVDLERIHLQSWLSGVRIGIKPNSLDYRTDERKNGIFEIFDVLIGPFNFYSDQSQSVVSKHSGRSVGLKLSPFPTTMQLAPASDECCGEKPTHNPSDQRVLPPRDEKSKYRSQSIGFGNGVLVLPLLLRSLIRMVKSKLKRFEILFRIVVETEDGSDERGSRNGRRKNTDENRDLVIGHLPAMFSRRLYLVQSTCRLFYKPDVTNPRRDEVVEDGRPEDARDERGSRRRHDYAARPVRAGVREVRRFALLVASGACLDGGLCARMGCSGSFASGRIAGPQKAGGCQ